MTHLDNTLRIGEINPASNGKPSKGKPVRKPSKPRAKKLKELASCDVHQWAHAGAGVTLTMSALLNGYANSQHATVYWAGWAMGLAIPAIVLILSRVAGLNYRSGKRQLAYAGAIVGCGLLLLSVWHCATSIAMLTGSSILLAVPLAIAIDAGLVYCEINTL